MNWKIPLFKIHWEQDDLNAISNVIKRGTYWTTGPEIEEIENKITKLIGKKYGVSFNSGTSALHAVLLAHKITRGEVIVPSFTFISTANAVVLAGAKPVFAEIENETYGLDPEDVKERITSKTKAIIPVHIGGSPCRDIKALKEITEDKNLVLIEDAAESLGSKIDNKMVGSHGHSSMFSFCQNKIVTSGEGGMIVTDLKDIYQKLKLIRSHGRVENKDDYFSSSREMDYIDVGYNYRMSSITAALALTQFNKINKIIKIRREKASYYNDKLSKISSIKTPVEKKNHLHVYQMYTIQSKDNKLRDKIQQSFKNAKIMTKIYFSPIHLKTFYRKKFNYKKGDLPMTEKISGKVITLPLYPGLTKKDMDSIINKIKDCCE